MTTAVLIGRNIGDEPMEAGAWADFRYLLGQQVRYVLDGWNDVYFEGSGKGNSERWGSEDSYCIVFRELYGDEREDFVKWLRILAEHYKQEAIALVERGETTFVTVGT